MIKEKLEHEYKLLKKQYEWLLYSLDECEKIGLKKEYSIDEFGKFETLCSRYARGIDFLIRKVFRTIDEFEFENQGTLIDTINKAHKRALFEDIDELRMMKDIKNTIVHEYIEEDLVEVFEDVLFYGKKLTTIMQNTFIYMDKIL